MDWNNSGKYGVAAILLSALLVLASAWGVRHGLLENGLLPRDCTLPDAHGGLCLFKTVLVESFLHQRMGWFSLACGGLAFVLGRRWLAWAGWLSGLAGLVRLWWGLWVLLMVLALPRRALLPLWLAGLLAAVALHWTLGPAQGLLPVADLGPVQVLALYAIPAALAVRLGALIGIPLRLTQVKT